MTTTTLPQRVPSSTFELGIDIDFRRLVGWTSAEVELQVERLMAYARSLQSNAITLSFPFSMPSPSSDVVEADAATPTMSQLEMAIAAARREHLAVTLRPYLDQPSLKLFGSEYWSGVIAPSNVSAWITSLSAFITPYLELAQQTGAITFVVGSELNSLVDAPSWVTLLARASQIFHGHLSYAANFDKYASDEIGVPVHYVGVDAYPPQDLPSTATVAELTKGWISWFNEVPLTLRARTTIYEIGIPATAGAYVVPYAWALSGRYDEAVQANWFHAACAAARVSGIRGLYFWGIASNQTFASPGSAERTHFYGRAAQSSIETCFASIYGNE